MNLLEEIIVVVSLGADCLVALVWLLIALDAVFNGYRLHEAFFKWLDRH